MDPCLIRIFTFQYFSKCCKRLGSYLLFGKPPKEIDEVLSFYIVSQTRSRCSVILTYPVGLKYKFCFEISFPFTNNQVEYEALIVGLEILTYMRVHSMVIVGDS